MDSVESTNSSPLLKLPPEIIDYMVSFITNHENLKSISVASRDLRNPAQRRLFATRRLMLTLSYRDVPDSDISITFSKFQQFLQHGTHLHPHLSQLTISHERPCTEEKLELQIIQDLTQFIKSNSTLKRLVLYIHANMVNPMIEAVDTHRREYIMMGPTNWPMATETTQSLTSPLFVQRVSIAPHIDTHYLAPYTQSDGIQYSLNVRQAGVFLARFQATITSLVLGAKTAPFVTAMAEIRFNNLYTFALYDCIAENTREIASLFRFFEINSHLGRIRVDDKQERIALPHSIHEQASRFLPGLEKFVGSLGTIAPLLPGRGIQQLCFQNTNVLPLQLSSFGVAPTVKEIDIGQLTAEDLDKALGGISKAFPAVEIISFSFNPSECKTIQFSTFLPALEPLVLGKLQSILFRTYDWALYNTKPYSSDQYWINQLHDVLDGIERMEREAGFIPGFTQGMRRVECHFLYSYSARRRWRVNDGDSQLVPFWDYCVP